MGKNTCQSKKKRKQNKHLHYIIINTEAWENVNHIQLFIASNNNSNNSMVSLGDDQATDKEVETSTSDS